MKKNFLFPAALFFMSAAHAQIRTANTASNISVSDSPAFIDASSNILSNRSSNLGKGLIFPRVDLSAMTDFPDVKTGIPNSFPTRFDGMIVYNTAVSGKAGIGTTSGTLSPGFWYYENKSGSNNGGTWKVLGANTNTNISATVSGGDNLGDHSATQHIALNNYELRLRGISDNSHSLVYNTAVNGPRLIGAGGGYLGTSNGTNALAWDINGDIMANRNISANGQIKSTSIRSLGDTQIDGNLNTVGFVKGSYINSTGDILAGGQVKASSIRSTGDTQIDGNLNTVGFVKGSYINSTGDILAGGQVKASSIRSIGDAQIDGNLNTVGFIKGSYINSTGDILAGGQVKASSIRSTGDAQIDGNLNTVGFIKGSYINSTGDILAGGQVKASSIRSTGDTQIDGNLNTVGFVKGSYINSTGNFLAGGQVKASSIRSTGDAQIDGNLNTVGFIKGSYINSTGNFLAGGQVKASSIRSTGDAQIDGNLNTVGFVLGSYIKSTGVGRFETRVETARIQGTSDKRFKKDITPIYNATQKLNQLNGYTYTWKDKKEFPGQALGEGKDIGVIAQEVEKVFPEAVMTNKEGYKSVNYNALIPVLIEALKESNKKIHTLEQRLNRP